MSFSPASLTDTPTIESRTVAHVASPVGYIEADLEAPGIPFAMIKQEPTLCAT